MTAANNPPQGKPRKPTKRAPSAAALTKAIKDQHESPRTPPQIDHDRRDTEKWPVAAMAAATPQLGTAPGVTIAGSSGSSGSSPETSCIDLALLGGYSPELVDWLRTRPVAEIAYDDAEPLVPAPRAAASPVDLPGVTIIEAGTLADLAPARADDVAVRAAAVAVRPAVAVRHALAREARPAPTVEPVAPPSPEPSLGMERRQAHRSRQRGIRGVLKWFSVPRSRRARADVARPAKETLA